MRRWSLIAASSTFHITNSCKSHIGNTERRKVKFIICVISMLHGVYTKFHQFPSILSIVIKYEQTDIAS
jgi:hypothetical protein